MSTHNICYYKEGDNITQAATEDYEITLLCAYMGMYGN